jgi:hypothetical protein
VTAAEATQTISRRLAEDACDTAGIGRDKIRLSMYSRHAGRPPGWAVLLPGVEQLAEFGAHLTVAALYEPDGGGGDVDQDTTSIRDMLACAAVEVGATSVVLCFPGWTLDG